MPAQGGRGLASKPCTHRPQQKWEKEKPLTLSSSLSEGHTLRKHRCIQPGRPGHECSVRVAVEAVRMARSLSQNREKKQTVGIVASFPLFRAAQGFIWPVNHFRALSQAAARSPPPNDVMPHNPITSVQKRHPEDFILCYWLDGHLWVHQLRRTIYIYRCGILWCR